MGAHLGQDATTRSDAEEKLAKALVELREAEAILTSIRAAVAVREEAHRVSSSWMDAMAEEARRALGQRALGRLMTPAWLKRLEDIASRHDTASARLEAAIAEEHLAIIAHAKIAARVRALRRELQRLGPAAPTGVLVPPAGVPVRIPYYPWIVSAGASPYYTIQWPT